METEVHPSAIVHPKADVRPGARVGPFAVIGPEVVLEPGAEVGHHVTLEGRVVIGPGARIGHGSIVGGVPQDLKFREGTPSGVRIGAGTIIRELVTVHRATQPGGWTEIGAGCLIMSTAHIAHDCVLGDGVVVINYAGITGHCRIEERATVGGYAGIKPFTRVGAFAYINGMCKVTADVPPFMIVDGQPATVRSVNVIGLRRAGMPADERRLVQDAYRLLYRSGLTPQRAVERIRAELPPTRTMLRLLAFLEASHGICAGPRRRGPAPVPGAPGREEAGEVDA
jgi:UDP-N-acetylglucosamine acyltransferase